MKSIILAGGEGTRLRPLTCNMPKPLIKLCGKPVLEYILDLLANNGCSNATFTLGYLGGKIENHFDGGFYKNIELDFVYEKEPLGTAGCVKAAMQKLSEPLLIISGDAMCDFDLTAIYRSHLASGAAATIVTKSVDDPREYGLIIENNGLVSGFSEKPSYLDAISDYANTGVYVISPEVLELIPNGEKYDFARDVFPKMLEKGMKIAVFKENGYWCDIGDIRTYKQCQSDILSGKVRCNFSNYCSENFYKDVKISEPCRIGGNVSIAAGTIIDDSTIIEDNVTIGKNCHISNSILLEGSFIGDNATCIESIVCENARLESGVQMYDNSIVGENSLIKKHSVIRGAKIWNDKTVAENSVVTNDVKHGNGQRIELNETGFSGETNTQITPEFATKLGAALAATFDGKMLIASDKTEASGALKAAICAGFTSAGSNITDCGDLPLAVLIYLSRILHAHGIIHISANINTEITLLNSCGLPLTRVEERKLESCINRCEYKNAHWDSFGKIEHFDNGILLYSAMLDNILIDKSLRNIKISCNNDVLCDILNARVSKISKTTGKDIIINLNYSGTKAEILSSEGTSVKFDQLVSILLNDLTKKGFDVAVPFEFSTSAETIADVYGKTVYRFYRCSNDNSDAYARSLAATQPFLFDGSVLALNVLQILTERGVSIEEEIEALPAFSVENRFLKINCPPQKILSRFLKNAHGMGEGIILNERDSRVLMRSNKSGSGIFVFAESASAEVAAELCDSYENLIKSMISVE